MEFGLFYLLPALAVFFVVCLFFVHRAMRAAKARVNDKFKSVLAWPKLMEQRPDSPLKWGGKVELTGQEMDLLSPEMRAYIDAINRSRSKTQEHISTAKQFRMREQAARDDEARSRRDDIMNPLHPLSPLNPVGPLNMSNLSSSSDDSHLPHSSQACYTGSDPHESSRHSSGSDWGSSSSSDSSSYSSSDSGSSSSSCD